MKIGDFQNPEAKIPPRRLADDLRLETIKQDLSNVRRRLDDLTSKAEIPNPDVMTEVQDVKRKFEQVQKLVDENIESNRRFQLDMKKNFGDYDRQILETTEQLNGLMKRVADEYGMLATKADLEIVKACMSSDLGNFESRALLADKTIKNELTMMIQEVDRVAKYEISEIDSHADGTANATEALRQRSEERFKKLEALQTYFETDKLNQVNEKIRHMEGRLELMDKLTMEKIDRQLRGIPYKSLGDLPSPFFKLEKK